MRPDRRALAAASIALSLIGVVAVVALHVLRPELAPISHRLSEYAIGRYGGVMTAAFVCVGASLLMLAGRHRRSGPAVVFSRRRRRCRPRRRGYGRVRGVPHGRFSLRSDRGCPPQCRVGAGDVGVDRRGGLLDGGCVAAGSTRRARNDGLGARRGQPGAAPLAMERVESASAVADAVGLGDRRGLRADSPPSCVEPADPGRFSLTEGVSDDRSVAWFAPGRSSPMQLRAPSRMRAPNHDGRPLVAAPERRGGAVGEIVHRWGRRGRLVRVGVGGWARTCRWSR